MPEQDDTSAPAAQSHLFTLRIWAEDLGGGQIDWRGRVQHVGSGDVRYFRDWPTLEAFVEGLLGGQTCPAPKGLGDSWGLIKTEGGNRP
jgi:hypothetical protein